MARPFLLFAVLALTVPPSEAVGPASTKGCSVRRGITLENLNGSYSLDVRPGIGVSGPENAYAKAYRFFGALMFSDSVPDAVQEADTLDRKLVTKLVLGGAGGYLLLVPCLALAAIVPVLGLRALWQRYKKPPRYQPKTEEQGATRQRTRLVFCILIVLLVVMTIGALLTMHHVSKALDSAKLQAQYLTDNIPAVLHKPLNDIGLIVGPNFKNFSVALDDRLTECSKESGSVVDHIFVSDPLLNFTTTAAHRLTAIKELVGKIEEVSHSYRLTRFRNNVDKASKSFRAVLSACIQHTCDGNSRNHVRNVTAKLEELFKSSEIELPPALIALRDEVKKDSTTAILKKIPSSKDVKKDIETKTKEVQKRLQELGDRLNKTIGQLDDSIGRLAQRAHNLADTLQNPPNQVETDLSRYSMVIALVVSVMGVVVGIYICGIQCMMSRAPTGYCSVNTANKAMTVGALVFLLFFPILMVASSLGMTMGLAIDRKICSPALNIGAPSSRPFLEFLASKLSTKEASHRSSAPDEGAAQITDVLHVAGRRRRVGGGSSGSRRPFPSTSASGIRRRKRGSVASFRHRLHRTKCHASFRGTTCDIAEGLRLLERGSTGSLVGRRPRPRGKDTARGVGGFALPADVVSAFAKEITPTSLGGVAERFSQCSHTGLSLFKLFGKDLVRVMARIVMGLESPWLGLVDDGAGDPKIEAIEKMGSEFPRLSKDIKAMLEEFGRSPINIEDIKALSAKVQKARQDFDHLETLGADFGVFLRRAKNVDQSLEDLLVVVDDILPQRPDFEAPMALIDEGAKNLTEASVVEQKTLDNYLQENVDKWDILELVFGNSTKQVLQVGQKAKTGFTADLMQFFNHTKKQIREHVGDCRPLHALYMSSVETACTQGVALLATFWTSVWTFVMLGIPSVVVALALATQFARSAVQKEEDKGKTGSGEFTKRLQTTKVTTLP